jgi:hypothetical protein
MCAASGLNPDTIKEKVLQRVQSTRDLLRILMEEVAQSQSADRWAAWGPDNLLYMPQI